MSAGQIAYYLHEEEIKKTIKKDVTINYQAHEYLHGILFKKNPIPDLEWYKYDFDYEWMCYQNALYSTGRYFPYGVDFKEPAEPALGKKEARWCFPEKEQPMQERGMKMIESMNKRIHEESEGGTKRVCYLIITHAIFVD